MIIFEYTDLPKLHEMERDLIRAALERHDGHRGRACRTLGLTRPRLLRKMRKYGLDSRWPIK